MSVEPGTIIAGDFEIVEPLSEGGMGAVYVALQRSVGRRRALKVMHRELLADQRLVERFVQEAKIGATIDSEHVVEVIAAGVDERLKMPFLAMELLEGKDLAALIAARGQLAMADLSEVMDQLCHALAAAHDGGVVHRDLKPENVFVARTRRKGSPFVVKVLDFGIAKVLAEARATAAATSALGTPTFMAPEQTEARSKVTPAADVWALGLIAFRALTGKHFWLAANEEGASLTALMRELLFDPIPAASERAAALGVEAALPEGFDGWFARCTARDPGERLPNARAAHDAFKRLEASSSVDAVTLQEALVPEPRAERPDATRAKATIAAAPLDAASGTVAAAPLEARSQTVAAVPLQLATGSERTRAVAPLPAAAERGKARRSLLGPAIGGLAVVGVGVALLVSAQGEGENPSPTASETPSASAPPAPSGSSPPASASNRFVVITPPRTSVILGVPDDAPATRRGLRPARWVTSPEARYEIQAFEVTWAELEPFLAANPLLTFERPSGVPTAADARASLPATGVPHEVATGYCKSIGGALPTEAEWEFAARGASLRAWPWTTEAVKMSELAIFLGPGGAVSKVGSSRWDVTPEGVHDLLGNAREWTSTRWVDDVPQPGERPLVEGAAEAIAVRGLPLLSPRPEGMVEIDLAYRDWVCAGGGCSPLSPGASVAPPLATLVVTPEAASGASKSALRAWVEGPEFGEQLGRCLGSAPLPASLRVTLRAEAKGCKHASLPPTGDSVHAVFTVDAAPSPYVFVQDAPAGNDRDGDGLPDASDQCPSQREDVDGFQDADGCPDPDNDGDGITDAKDQCPNQPETVNGLNDADGCPDSKIAELLDRPPPAPKPEPAPTSRPAPQPTSGREPTCAPTRAALSTTDLSPPVLACLEAAAPSSLTSNEVWSDEVRFSIKVVKVPPALRELGFRCVRRVPSN